MSPAVHYRPSIKHHGVASSRMDAVNEDCIGPESIGREPVCTFVQQFSLKGTTCV